MDKIARLRQEIERRIKLYDGNNNQELWIGNTYRAVLSFLDTLSEEPDKSLEEAAEEYTQKMLESWRFDSTGCRPPRESFIAGAEWQASQMPMPEDTALFNKGVAEGRRLEREDMMKGGNVILAEEDFDAEKEKSMEWGYNLCKQQMLKDAMEATVTTNLANRPVIYLDQLHGFEYGDKVKVIVLKDNEDESK